MGNRSRLCLREADVRTGSPNWCRGQVERVDLEPDKVSKELVIEPHQMLELIGITAEHMDEFRAGRSNYHTDAKKIDWNRFGNQAVDLLAELRCKYLVRADLKADIAMAEIE